MSWVWKKYIIELIKFREFVVIFSRSGMYRWQSYSLASPSVFFFLVSFVYCFAWPFFLYTRCKIYNQDSDERHYFLREREKRVLYLFLSCFFLRVLILMLIVSLHFGNVWLSDERRPLYIVSPPIIVDGWYILIG